MIAVPASPPVRMAARQRLDFLCECRERENRMKEYTIHRFDTVEESQSAPWTAVSQYCWGGAYRPQMRAQIALVAGKGFVCRMQCDEREPVARYESYFSPVYTDSCMEWFCAFGGEGDPRYLNVESNSRGACLCEIGTFRGDRKDASTDGRTPPVSVLAQPLAAGWSLETVVPFETIARLFGVEESFFVPGRVLRGNLYKCCETDPFTHFAVWNPVSSPTPDFHRPESFGRFVIGD